MRQKELKAYMKNGCYDSMKCNEDNLDVCYKEFKSQIKRFNDFCYQ